MSHQEQLIDQETFITKLALEILEGRSFDVTGKKCSYEMLFNNVVSQDSDPEEEEAEDPVPVPEKKHPRKRGYKESLPLEQDKFIRNMLIKVDGCYERLLAEEMVWVRDFRKAMKTETYTQVQQMAMYREENNIDAKCKSILGVINSLQQKFKDVKRLNKVTTNLQRLSQVVSFEDKR